MAGRRQTHPGAMAPFRSPPDPDGSEYVLVPVGDDEAVWLGLESLDEGVPVPRCGCW